MKDYPENTEEAKRAYKANKLKSDYLESTLKAFRHSYSITQESEDVTDYIYANLLNTGSEINLRDVLYFGVELYADKQACKEQGFTILTRQNPLFCNVSYIQVLILVNNLQVTMEELMYNVNDITE